MYVGMGIYYVITEKHGTNQNENNISESISKYVQNKVGDASSVSRTTGNYSKGNRLKLTRRDKLKE